MAVWDGQAGRLTFYAPGSGVVDHMATPQPSLGQFPALAGVSGTDFVLREGLDMAGIFARGAGAHRDTVRVVRYASATGEVVDTIGAWPGNSMQAWVEGGSFSFRGQPFAP